MILNEDEYETYDCLIILTKLNNYDFFHNYNYNKKNNLFIKDKGIIKIHKKSNDIYLETFINNTISNNNNNYNNNNSNSSSSSNSNNNSYNSNISYNNSSNTTNTISSSLSSSSLNFLILFDLFISISNNIFITKISKSCILNNYGNSNRFLSLQSIKNPSYYLILKVQEDIKKKIFSTYYQPNDSLQNDNIININYNDNNNNNLNDFQQLLKKKFSSLTNSPLSSSSSSSVSTSSNISYSYLQEKCFNEYDNVENKDNIKLFSMESKENGKRYFFYSSYKEFSKIYKEIDKNKTHIYEIIRENYPCRLYFDLEYSNTKKNENVDGKQLTLEWIQLIIWKLYQYYSVDFCTLKDFIVLDSSTPNKFSKHIILNLFDEKKNNNRVKKDEKLKYKNYEDISLDGDDDSDNDESDESKEKKFKLREELNEKLRKDQSRRKEILFHDNSQIKHFIQLILLDITEPYQPDMNNENFSVSNTYSDNSCINELKDEDLIDFIENQELYQRQFDEEKLNKLRSIPLIRINGVYRTPLKQYKKFWIWNSDEDRLVFFVDIGVYTRNRAFRLFSSTKFGKKAHLKNLKEDRILYKDLTTPYLSLIEKYSSYFSSSINLIIFDIMLQSTCIIPFDLFLKISEDEKLVNNFITEKEKRNYLNYKKKRIKIDMDLKENEELEDNLDFEIQKEFSGLQKNFNYKNYKILSNIFYQIDKNYNNKFQLLFSFQYDNSFFLPFSFQSLQSTTISQPIHQSNRNLTSLTPIVSSTSLSPSTSNLNTNLNQLINSFSFPSIFPLLDNYIYKYIQQQFNSINCSEFSIPPQLKQWKFIKKYNEKSQLSYYYIYYYFNHYRYCNNIKKYHKSNGVWFEINLLSKEVLQRCFDPDCYGFVKQILLLDDYNLLLSNKLNCPSNLETLQDAIAYIETLVNSL